MNAEFEINIVVLSIDSHKKMDNLQFIKANGRKLYYVKTEFDVIYLLIQSLLQLILQKALYIDKLILAQQQSKSQTFVSCLYDLQICIIKASFSKTFLRQKTYQQQVNRQQTKIITLKLSRRLLSVACNLYKTGLQAFSIFIIHKIYQQTSNSYLPSYYAILMCYDQSCFLNTIYSMDLTDNEIRRKSLLQSNILSHHTQFGQMHRSLNQLLHQNLKKHQQILQAKPNFQYQLYKVPQNKNQSLNFGKELLMRQLDRLMEQQNYLNRELSLISFQRQQSLGAKQELITTEINPFQVLRGIWTSKRETHTSSLQHAESLNETVGSIKLSIRKLYQIEKDSHAQHTSDYLKHVLGNEQKRAKCSSCQENEQSKKQLRETIGKLSDQLNQLADKNRNLQEQIASKDEAIRKLTKKSMQNETETRSKMMFLQEKLLMEDHQIKQLSKFKADLERNLFANQQQKYQIYVKTEQDISGFCRNINISLYQLLENITNQEGRSSSNGLKCQMDSQEHKAQAKENISINDLLLPELALPIGLSNDNLKKVAATQRPKTDRKRAFNQMATQRLQDLQQAGKKYMRTKQLTTTRNNNNKTIAYSPIETKITVSTLKLGDSPKSIQQQK